MSTFAIINDRGRQFKVREGEALRLDLLKCKDGAEVTFKEVLLVGSASGVKSGRPFVSGASVTGVVSTADIKGDKTIAHRRVRTNSAGTRSGHRARYSVVKITKING